MKYIILCILFSCGIAKADVLPETITLHMASAYSQNNAYLNNYTPGFGLKWSNGLSIGAYQNGRNKTTAYVGRSFGTQIYGPVVGGLLLGVYKSNPRPGFHLMAVPTIGLILTPSTKVNFSYAAKDCGKCVHTLHLSMEVKL